LTGTSAKCFVGSGEKHKATTGVRDGGTIHAQGS